jgi:hypothetical protein
VGGGELFQSLFEGRADRDQPAHGNATLGDHQGGTRLDLVEIAAQLSFELPDTKW